MTFLKKAANALCFMIIILFHSNVSSTLNKSGQDWLQLIGDYCEMKLHS